MACSCKIDSDGDIHIYLLSKICHTACLVRLSQKYSVFSSLKYQEQEARNKRENFIFGLHLNSLTNTEVSRSVGLTWKKCLKSKASNENQMKLSLSALSLCEWLIKHMCAFLIPPKNTPAAVMPVKSHLCFPAGSRGIKGNGEKSAPAVIFTVRPLWVPGAVPDPLQVRFLPLVYLPQSGNTSWAGGGAVEFVPGTRSAVCCPSAGLHPGISFINLTSSTFGREPSLIQSHFTGCHRAQNGSPC